MAQETAALSTRISELTQRLEKEPGTRVFMELAKEHQKAGSLEDAVRICRDCLERHPGYHAARVQLSKALLAQENFTDAAGELDKVVTQAPDNLLARKLLGDARFGAGDRTGALETYRSLLLLNPDDREARSRVEELESGPSDSADLPEAEEFTMEAPPAAEKPQLEPVAEAEDTDEATESAPVPAIAEPEPAGEPEPAAEMESVEQTPDPEPAPLMAEIAAPTAEGPVDEFPDALTEADAAAPGEEVEEEDPTTLVARPGPPPRPESTEALSAGEVPGAEEDDIEEPDAPEPLEAEAPEAQHPAAEFDDQPMEPEPLPPTVALDAEDAVEALGEPAFEEAEPIPEPPAEPVEPTPEPPIAEEPASFESHEADPEPEQAPDQDLHEPGAGLEALPTPTLAEMYASQGLPEKALDVYREILEGDPSNEEAGRRVEELSAGLATPASRARRKIKALEGWLGRIRRERNAKEGT